MAYGGYGVGASVGGEAAQGLQAGFGMGMQLDQANERKRIQQFEETRQTAADARAADELELRKKGEARLEQSQADAAAEKGVTALLGRQKEIIAAGQKAQLAGQPLDDAMVQEYGRNAAMVKQAGQNWISRLQTGQVSLDQASPSDAYANISAATGMTINDMRALPQGVNDWQTGMQTGNKQLMLKGANTVMAPRLRMGIGDDDPHGSGGKISKKELVDVAPARDANGVDHPDKMFPVIRTTVTLPDGSTKYYDAPATPGGSTDPNATITPVAMKDAFDFMGQAGTFAASLKNPAFMDKLEAGAKSLDAQHAQALDELTNLTRAKPNLKTQIVRGGNKNTLVTVDENTGKVVSTQEFGVGATPRQFNPNTGGGGTLRAQLAALDQDYESGEYDGREDEYAQDRHDIIMSARGRGATPKGSSNAEITSIGNEAANRVASGLGLHYDKITGAYKDAAGNRATATQQKQIDESKDAAITTARNNAAKGKRTSGDEAKAATPATAAPDPLEGRTASGPNGAKMIRKGGKWVPLSQ